MSTRQTRRRRGKHDDGPLRRKIGTETIGVYTDVTPDVKQRIDEYRAATGFPIWAIVEAAIRAGEPGPNGYPTNWPLPPELNAEAAGKNYDSDLTEVAAQSADFESDVADMAEPRRSDQKGSEAAA